MREREREREREGWCVCICEGRLREEEEIGGAEGGRLKVKKRGQGWSERVRDERQKGR